MYPGERWVCGDPEDCMRVKRLLQEEVAKLQVQLVTVQNGDARYGNDALRERVQELELERDTALSILKRLVIAWDADQDLEFDDALAEARAAVGFVLAKET